MQVFSNFPSTIPAITDTFLDPDSLITMIFKIGLVLVVVMYVVYAIVIARQVKIMNKTVSTPLGPVIQILAWLHLVFAIVFAIGILFFL